MSAARQNPTPSQLERIDKRLAALETFSEVSTASSTARDRRLDDLAKDTRESRDGVRELTTVIREQDMAGRVEKLRADMTADSAALRQDLVKAHNDHEVRLQALENVRAQAKGMGALVRALKDYGGWIVGLIAVALHFFDKGGLR